MIWAFLWSASRTALSAVRGSAWAEVAHRRANPHSHVPFRTKPDLLMLVSRGNRPRGPSSGLQSLRGTAQKVATVTTLE